MNLNFQALEAAISSLQEIGQGEATFPVNDIPITLRTLLPEEDAEVQSYAGQALADDAEGNTPSQTLTYIERFKVGIIAHALVAIGGQDFRGVEFIETGEKLPNGNSVKIPKLKAMRDLVTKMWSGQLRTIIFTKYKELLDQVDLKADKTVRFDPIDIDSEITRLEARIAELKEEKEKRSLMTKSGLSEQIQRIVDLEALRNSGESGTGLIEAESAEEVPPVEAAPPATKQAAPQPRQPITPGTAAPPPNSQASPATPPQREVQKQPSHANDFDLEEALTPEMVEQENRRLMIERLQRGQTLGEPVTGVRVPPPHLRAREDAEAIQQEAALLGQTEKGVPVYAMPSEELSQSASDRAQKRMVVDRPTPNAHNPRFKPAR